MKSLTLVYLLFLVLAEVKLSKTADILSTKVITKIPSCTNTSLSVTSKTTCLFGSTLVHTVYSKTENGKPCTVTTQKCKQYTICPPKRISTDCNSGYTQSMRTFLSTYGGSTCIGALPTCVTTSKTIPSCTIGTKTIPLTKSTKCVPSASMISTVLTSSQSGEPCTIRTQVCGTTTTTPTKIPSCTINTKTIPLTKSTKCVPSASMISTVLTSTQSGKPCTIRTQVCGTKTIPNPEVTACTDLIPRPTCLPGHDVTSVPYSKTSSNGVVTCTGVQFVCTEKNPITTECIPQKVTVTVTEKQTTTIRETITVTVKGPTVTPEQHCANKWAQCGGVGFNGPTCCQSGSTCRKLNEYYSQCI